jgi:hypothetical protein
MPTCESDVGGTEVKDGNDEKNRQQHLRRREKRNETGSDARRVFESNALRRRTRCSAKAFGEFVIECAVSDSKGHGRYGGKREREIGHHRRCDAEQAEG